jgi:hypothetical protein
MTADHILTFTNLDKSLHGISFLRFGLVRLKINIQFNCGNFLRFNEVDKGDDIEI